MTIRNGPKIKSRHILKFFHFEGLFQLFGFALLFKPIYTTERMNILNQNKNAPK